MARRKKKPGNPLEAWAFEVLGGMGLAEASRRANKSDGWLSGMLGRGSGRPEAIAELARALGASPIEAFKVLGWITVVEAGEAPPVALIGEEPELVSRFRKAPEIVQKVILAGLRAQTEQPLAG